MLRSVTRRIGDLTRLLFAIAPVVSAQIVPAPPGSEVKRLEYVNYSPGHCEVISSAPNPAVACAGYCCAMGRQRTQYSLCFRANGDDNVVFQGLDYGLFSGFRARQSLRDIMNLKSGAGAKLAEFDHVARSSTVLSNIGLGLMGCSLLSLLGIIPANSLYERTGKVDLTFLWVSCGSLVAGAGFLSASEYRNAVACQRLLDAISEFNK